MPETIARYAAERDILAQLPPAVAGTDFEPLPVGSLDQVRAAFARAAGAAFADTRYEVRVR